MARGWYTRTHLKLAFRYAVTAEGGSEQIRSKVLHAVLDGEQRSSLAARRDVHRSVAPTTLFKPTVSTKRLANVLLSPRRKERILVIGQMFLRPETAVSFGSKGSSPRARRSGSRTSRSSAPTSTSPGPFAGGARIKRAGPPSRAGDAANDLRLFRDGRGPRRQATAHTGDRLLLCPVHDHFHCSANLLRARHRSLRCGHRAGVERLAPGSGQRDEGVGQGRGRRPQVWLESGRASSSRRSPSRWSCFSAPGC